VALGVVSHRDRITVCQLQGVGVGVTELLALGLQHQAERE
jgi:hypothetical protein